MNIVELTLDEELKKFTTFTVVNEVLSNTQALLTDTSIEDSDKIFLSEMYPNLLSIVNKLYDVSDWGTSKWTNLIIGAMLSYKLKGRKNCLFPLFQSMGLDVEITYPSVDEYDSICNISISEASLSDTAGALELIESLVSEFFWIQQKLNVYLEVQSFPGESTLTLSESIHTDYFLYQRAYDYDILGG